MSSDGKTTPTTSGSPETGDNAKSPGDAAPIGDVEKSKETGDRPADTKGSYNLPSWVVQSCTTLREEWADREDLVLRDLDTPKEKPQPHPSGYVVADPPDGTAREFEMAPVLFEPLDLLIAPAPASAPTPTPDTAPPGAETAVKDAPDDKDNVVDGPQPVRFRRSMVMLEDVVDPSIGSRGFSKSVAFHLAKKASADIVVLTTDDLVDLADYCRPPGRGSPYTDDFVRHLCSREGGDKTEADKTEANADESTTLDSTDDEKQSTGRPRIVMSEPDDPSADRTKPRSALPPDVFDPAVPISAVFSAPEFLRMIRSATPHRREDQALILYVVMDTRELWTPLLETLHQMTTRETWPDNLLIVISRFPTWAGPGGPGRKVVGDRDSRSKLPYIPKIPIAPLKTEAQRRLMEAGREHEALSASVRSTLRGMRRHFPLSTGWVSEPDSIFQYMLFEDDEQSLALDESHWREASLFTDDGETKQMYGKFLDRVAPRKKALEAWVGEEEEASDGQADGVKTTAHGDWSDYPYDARRAIRKIREMRARRTEHARYWETRFLNHLTRPGETGWAVMSLAGEETRRALEDCIGRIRAETWSKLSEGLLRDSNLGGVLVYGPPGTGKTLLSRVLAHEFKKVPVITVSAADLVRPAAEQTERAIRGLFNLGRLLGPAVIFIDQADVLLSGGGHSNRTRVAQFLNEMDRVPQAQPSSPLVILSTSFPGELDPAVLRRVPVKSHLGLPLTSQREEIFNIVLKEEVRADDVDVGKLARVTHGYSGSDIKNVCLQAALLCKESVGEGEDKGKRLLGFGDFEAALARVGPSVTEALLSSTREFMSEVDPRGLERLKELTDLDARTRAEQ